MYKITHKMPRIGYTRQIRDVRRRFMGGSDRTQKVTVCLTEDERDQIMARCKTHRTTLSDWIRGVILDSLTS